MTRWINRIITVMFFALSSQAYATAIFNITPSSTSPINIGTMGSATLPYTVTNNTNKTTFTNIIVDPYYGIPSNLLSLTIQNNTCSNIALPVGASCTFNVAIQANGHSANVLLRPRVCGFNGAICSVPTSNEVPIVMEDLLVYITNLRAPNSVIVCAADPNTFLLSNCSTTGDNSSAPFGITFNSAKNRIYITNPTGFPNSVGVTTCKINGDSGVLYDCTITGESVFYNPANIIINPSNTHAYIANNLAGNVTLCNIEAGTGLLTGCAATQLFQNPAGLAINPAGTFVYVATDTTNPGNNVLRCNVNPANGQLTNCVDPGVGFLRGPIFITLNAAGTFAYIASGTELTICGVNQADGTFNGCFISNAVTHSPTSIAFTNGGMSAYLVDNFNNTVGVCSVNQATGDFSGCTFSGNSLFSSILGIVASSS